MENLIEDVELWLPTTRATIKRTMHDENGMDERTLIVEREEDGIYEGGRTKEADGSALSLGGAGFLVVQRLGKQDCSVY
jgi:hypothetical protein